MPTFEEDARRLALGQAMRLGLKSKLHLNVLPQLWGESSDTIETTLDTAQRCNIDPSQLVLELKHESTVIRPELLAERLKGLRNAGVKLSIDDFGSGHAGLALLDHYQPELISLDKWLARGIERHGARQAILRGLVQTCDDLGIDIIAKGVETIDEFQWLFDEGIQLFQGYLFARPQIRALPRPMLPALQT